MYQNAPLLAAFPPIGNSITERVAQYEKLTGARKDHARFSGDRAARGRASTALPAAW